MFLLHSYSLTLIDALDTLAIMGNYTEFRRVARHLIDHLDFDEDINVSVFETNIRGERKGWKKCEISLDYGQKLHQKFGRKIPKYPSK